MSYCEHCEGQRFDRARVLRELRQLRRELRTRGDRKGEQAVQHALEAVRSMEIPHLDWEDDAGPMVH
jgi:hypothetical protein